jgi:hypothetical protein
LRDHGFELADIEGHPFDPGLPIAVINLADFAAEDTLVIDQVIEPVILKGGAVVKTGTALVRKASR